MDDEIYQVECILNDNQRVYLRGVDTHQDTSGRTFQWEFHWIKDRELAAKLMPMSKDMAEYYCKEAIAHYSIPFGEAPSISVVRYERVAATH